VAVADLGGISAAAEHLGYAQSSLSAQISSLERELGVRVLNRTTSGTTLTEAGNRLLPYARESLDLDNRMRRAAVRARPSVRVGGLETLASEWLPDILAALGYGAGGPGTEADVALSVGNRARLTADLDAGKLDLIFLFDNGAAATGPQAVVGEDETVLVTAPEHPLACRRLVTVDALLATEFLIAEPGCTTQMLVDQFGRDLTHRAPIGMVTGSLGALLRMLTHGRGVALLPSLAAARYLSAGELVQLDTAATLPPVHIEARWRTGLGPADHVIQAILQLARRSVPGQTGRETAGSPITRLRAASARGA
jgi:DNA-binding transcriptional LysR family regulator